MKGILSILIVEDDPMVSALLSKYVHMDSRYCVAATCRSGAEGLVYLSEHPGSTDLLFLDFYMPGMRGDEFMEHLRRRPDAPAVIIITAADDLQNIRQLSGYGPFDYILKPFESERLLFSLENFYRRERLADTVQRWTQSDIDAYLGKLGGIPEAPKEIFPININPRTYRAVLGLLMENPGRAMTAQTIAARLSVSPITIRRYLKYMLETGVVRAETERGTGGRPAVKYACIEGGG